MVEEERLTTSFSTSDDGEPTLLHVVASRSRGDGWAPYPQWAEPENKWVAVSSGHRGSLRPTLKRVNYSIKQCLVCVDPLTWSPLPWSCCRKSP